MQNTSHVAMGNWPTQEDWEKAQNILLSEISKSKEQTEPLKEISFFEFMICVLFILERVGVKSIVNTNDVMNCLEQLYDDNRTFYPSHIFRGAWKDSQTTIGNGTSIAEIFFEYLKEIQMVSFVGGRENVLVLCSSNYASEGTKKRFYCDLESACNLLK